MQYPVLQTLLRRRLRQLQEIPCPQIRHESQAGARDCLVDKEAADGRGEKTETVELGEAVVHFRHYETQEGGDDACAARLTRVFGMLEVAAEEGGDVWSGLADDEVVHVEKFGDAAEG